MSIYNNSRLRTYEKCPRKYYYESVRGLRRRSEWGNVDRDEGTMLHNVLQVFLDTGRIDRSLEVITNYYASQIADAGLDVEREVAVERRDYMKAFFEAYTRRWVGDNFEVVETERQGITCLGDNCYKCGAAYDKDLIEGKAVQKTCHAPIHFPSNNTTETCDAPIRYLVGQADLLYLENNMLKLMDHKTKGGKSPSASDPYMAAFHESPQFLQYMYIFSRNCLNPDGTSRPVHTAVANVLAKLKTIDKRGVPFKRETVVKGQRDLDAFVKDRHALIETIEREMEQLHPDGTPIGVTQPFRRNLDACHDFGLCPMFGICHPPREDWWNLPFDIADDYEQESGSYVEDYRKLIDEEVQ